LSSLTLFDRLRLTQDRDAGRRVQLEEARQELAIVDVTWGTLPARLSVSLLV